MQGATQTEDGVPTGSSVLWRHVAAATSRRAGAEMTGALPVRAAARSPERVVAGAIGRAADRIHRMPLFFDRVQWSEAALAELGELLPEGALVSVIEGPGDSLGIVGICPELLAAITEMQTAGRVSSRPAPPRRPTRTDGSICSDFINALLAELGADPSLLPGRDRIRGYRYASHLDDLRALDLLLEDGGFHLLSVGLRAGEAGQRNGQLVIAWPVDPAQPACESGNGAAPPEDCTKATSLADAVLDAPFELRGILCRRRISLRELAALAPGDVVALPPDVLGAATLETALGQVLFRGKLGEMAGRHALRLLADGASVAGTADPATAPPSAATAGPDALSLGDLDSPDPFRAVHENVDPHDVARAGPGHGTLPESA